MNKKNSPLDSVLPYKWIPLVLILVLFTFEKLQAVPYLSQGISYQGRIISPDGTPFEANNVPFYIQILSPGTEACVLYEETQTLIMTGSNGFFSLSIGKGTRTGADTGLNFSTIFQNTNPLTALTSCALGSSYSPTFGDNRKIRVKFNDGTQLVSFSSDYTINSVPQAQVAETLQSKTPSDFIQVSAGSYLTQENINAIFSNYTELQALLNGTSTAYAKTNALAGQALATTAPTLGQVLSYDGTQWVPSTPTTTTSGTLAIARGGTGASTAAMARTNLGLGPLATMATSGNTDGTKFLRDDGAWATISTGSGGSITAIVAGNGLSGNTSGGVVNINLADIGTAGTYTKITTDAQGRVSTGASLLASDIPNLETSKITSGSFSDSLLASLSINKLINGTSKYLDYRPNNVACGTNEILKYSTGTGWICATDTNSGGTITSITAGAGLSGGAIVNAGTISLTTTGVTAGSYGTTTEVPKITVDNYGRVTNVTAQTIQLNMSAITSGTLPITQGGTGATSGSSAFNAISPLTTKGDIIYFDGYKHVRLPAGTKDQVLVMSSTGIPTWETRIVRPTNLVATQTKANGAAFTISWDGGRGNGTCILQYSRNSVWTDFGTTTYNCDDTVSASLNFMTTTGTAFLGASWTSIPLRLVAYSATSTASTELVIASFPTNSITCTNPTSTEPSPATLTAANAVDADCNGTFNNQASYGIGCSHSLTTAQLVMGASLTGLNTATCGPSDGFVYSWTSATWTGYSVYADGYSSWSTSAYTDSACTIFDTYTFYTSSIISFTNPTDSFPTTTPNYYDWGGTPLTVTGTTCVLAGGGGPTRYYRKPGITTWAYGSISYSKTATAYY